MLTETWYISNDEQVRSLIKSEVEKYEARLSASHHLWNYFKNSFDIKSEDDLLVITKALAEDVHFEKVLEVIKTLREDLKKIG